MEPRRRLNILTQSFGRGRKLWLRRIPSRFPRARAKKHDYTTPRYEWLAAEVSAAIYLTGCGATLVLTYSITLKILCVAR